MSINLFLLKKEVYLNTKHVGVYKTEVTPMGVYVSEDVAKDAAQQFAKALEETKNSTPPIPYEIAMGNNGTATQRKLWIDWDIKRYHASFTTKFLVEPIPLFK